MMARVSYQGDFFGVRERIRQLTGSCCPYVHCHAHRLNLVLVDTCKSVPYAGEVIGLLEEVIAILMLPQTPRPVCQRT